MDATTPPHGTDGSPPTQTTVDAPPQHGPGSTVDVAKPEDAFPVALRLEPFGPPTTVIVTRDMTMGAVKAAALRNIGRPPSVDKELILTKGGWKVDEEETVGSLGLYEYEFLSIGRPGELFLAENAWRPPPHEVSANRE